MPDPMADRFRNWFRLRARCTRQGSCVRWKVSRPSGAIRRNTERRSAGSPIWSWLGGPGSGRLGVIPHQVDRIFPDKDELARCSAESAGSRGALVPTIWPSLSDEDLGPNDRVQEHRRRSVSEPARRHTHPTLRSLVVSSRTDRYARPSSRRSSSGDGFYLLVSRTRRRPVRSHDRLMIGNYASCATFRVNHPSEPPARCPVVVQYNASFASF